MSWELRGFAVREAEPHERLEDAGELWVECDCEVHLPHSLAQRMGQSGELRVDREQPAHFAHRLRHGKTDSRARGRNFLNLPIPEDRHRETKLVENRPD